MDKHQAIWDARYAKLLRGESTWVSDPWLEGWLHLAPRGECRRAFDVGCGAGYNAALLLQHGFEVTAIDFSERALELCRRAAPKARVEWADIRDGLSFAGDRFGIIVADLSLHYFTWDTTEAIFRDVANMLVPGGVFAGRFNSTGDANYGAGAGEPVPGEANLLIVDGVEKRFFTRECFSKLFGPPWTTAALAEKTTGRYGPRKVFWELVAIKRDGSAAEDDTGLDEGSTDAAPPPVI